jgi:hypothetical protein
MPFAPWGVRSPGATGHCGQALAEYWSGIGWSAVGGRMPCRISITTRSTFSGCCASAGELNAVAHAATSGHRSNDLFIETPQNRTNRL